ncbi:MAG: nucleotidyltransferase domain-containing protein [Candidatus Kapabacteria bacterium]|nr:nucleotidyltransferase domain-containing protein [Candidatus Kapabacteria bacterium]
MRKMLIRDIDRERLENIFRKSTLAFEVWAYGSRVKGTAHSGSDLDLVIRGKDLQLIPFDIYSEIVETIRESNIPIIVELRDWARLPESFHKQIEKQYEILFSNL